MAETTETTPARFKGRVRAPELRGGLGWLNTDHPLSLAELRGRIVLLDFWTYCCINCMHVLPDLHTLEARYPNELTVIGVHSAKFTEEGQTDNIRQAIGRYEIAHPVVNDAEFAIWQQYGVRAWPTLMLVDPEGYVVAGYSGEGNLAQMDDDICALIALYPATKENAPLPISREDAPATALRYPGKVLADAGGRLFIADTNHNQIVIAGLDGAVQGRIGSGAVGRDDGDYATATFHHPQGMALAGDVLYVADTENHLLRAVDLAQRTVTTVAGTGDQARFRAVGGAALESALNSPWDLTIVSGYVLIAMAGPHQIWLYDPTSAQVGVFAGSGAEARVDGGFEDAAFAQPSGIATDGAYLFVADSETSSIRQLDIAEQSVATLAGDDLFEFGDVDGTGDTVRLQHPLGIVYDGADALYVADTYNSKIKRLDLETGEVRTVAGTGKAGAANGTPGGLYEPGGLSLAGGSLYIADTNNHAIRVLDLATGALSTLTITEGARASAEPFFPALEMVGAAPQTVAPGVPLTLAVTVALPPEHHINHDAPNAHDLRLDGAAVALPALTLDGDRGETLTVALPPLPAGTHDLRYTLTLYYCKEGNEAACTLRSLQWRVRVAAVEGVNIATLPLAGTLPPQE